MKTLITILIIIINSVFANAQDYKSTFAELVKYSDSGFKDILGQKKNDSPDGTLSFYQSRLDLKVGSTEIGIDKKGNGSIITWKIPLDKAKQVIIDFENFIQEKYPKDKGFYIDTQGKKTEGFEMKTVLDDLADEPLMMLGAIYSVDAKNPSNSSYIIQIFGN